MSGLTRPANEWERVLRESGVPQSILALNGGEWPRAFAQTIIDGCFSKGEAELPQFLATFLHESDMLRGMKENGYYTAQRIREIGMRSGPNTRWRQLALMAGEIEKSSAKFFEACYGGRLGNGPVGSGDGARYPGRGGIGLTGRANYARMQALTGLPLLDQPELAEKPANALRIALAWWEANVRDASIGDDEAVRRAVNGGTIGLEAFEHLCRRVESCL